MQKSFITTVFTLLLTIVTGAQSNKFDSFKKEWTEVEQFEVKGLPKSALEVVEKIYKNAKKKKNHPQIVKSLLYKSKFSLALEEDAQLKVINQLRGEIATSTFPTTNILESILADLYWQYFQRNRWKFYNRTKTSKKVDPKDFRTWDLQTIFEAAHIHYQKSLENALLLQQTYLGDYGAILIAEQGSIRLRPTLYDFLAHRAIDFYKTDERNLQQPKYKFEIDNPALLGSNEEFIKVQLNQKDSLSQQLNGLKIYKNLTLFHTKDDDPTAIIDLTLERLSFVKTNAIFNENEKVYFATLRALFQKYQDHEGSAEIGYRMAQMLREQALQYNPGKNDEHRWKNREALKICSEAIAKFPLSMGAKKCKSLRQQIINKSLVITNEKFIPIDQHSRLLVSYKNIDRLFFKALRVQYEQIKELNLISSDSAKIAFINTLRPVKNWQSTLPNETDYQNHKTEILVPKLQQGTYIVVASASQNLNKDETFAYGAFQVSNLTLLEENDSGNYSYQVVNRNTGKPIANAVLNITNEKNRYSKPYKRKLKTNKKGIATLSITDNYHNVTISVSKNKDTAVFGNYYIHRPYPRSSYDQDEELIARPFLFTDRSIYRPGQTVYFKGILIQKKGEQSKVVPKEEVTVTLYNVNNEEVSELEIKTNDFGAFSGQFILPNSGLNGKYYIEVDEGFEDSDFYDRIDDFYYDDVFEFSVEEYKRPKFETKFNPITDTFRINDSITVKGHAQAFAGSTITDAKVEYRVYRTAQYPKWYWFYSPPISSESQEITNGETTTDAEGNFKIIFKALPDLKVSPSTQPTFNYKVIAEVTDINGETRSTETIVNVGYHALTASITAAQKIDRDLKEHIINVSTTNLNGEFVATKGNLKIFKLKAPLNVLRPRPWEAPDYQNFSEEEFRKLFPNDPFHNEDDPKNWQKGQLIAEFNIDTENEKEIKLKGLQKWVSGKYIMEFVCHDKFGQEVRDEKRVDLFSTKETTIADSKLFAISTDKQAYSTGDNVLLKISSAHNNFNITVSVEKNHKIVKSYSLHLNNETKTIKVPVKKEDLGGFAIKYHFVALNSFKNGTVFIDVPYPKNQLKLDITTFRDKLLPGQQETWSFQLKGDKSEQVNAEILASMYDASLDQFVTHNWSFNPIKNRTYRSYGTIFRAGNSFGNNNFRSYIKNNIYYGLPKQYHNSLDWFGFSINNNKWVNSQYLNRIKSKPVSPEGQRPKYDKIISGVVTDESGPLPGVSVIIKGTSYGTETDFDGNYSIKVKDGDELIYSFVGMASVSRKINSKGNVNVVLQADNQLDEVVVTGYGVKREKRSLSYAVTKVESEEMDDSIANVLSGKVAGVQIVNNDGAPGADAEVIIRGLGSMSNAKNALYIVDGVVVSEFDINGTEVLSMTVLKGKEASAIYGTKGANGVILITTKSGQKQQDEELSKIKARKNLQETAFFYPHLTTDKNGSVSFNFTVPESLTRWKLQLLAHTKDLRTTTKQMTTVTQKELMVLPNPPRFFREGDRIVFAAKIANLTDKELSGVSELQLFDALTNKPINDNLGNSDKQQPFTINAKGNSNISWSLQIPDEFQAIKYKIVAKAGDFSDGEENALPVLSNRMLVTETLPMWLRSGQNKTFTLDKLKNSSSTTLKNHNLTLEITSNPAWYAVQALPYLMEYPYECAEQTFSRYYANALGSHIANSNPRIQEIFNQWKSSDALSSNLEKNQELKSLIIQETPWVRDAQSEAEQKKRISLLFDLNKMNNESSSSLQKLEQMQMSNGGFPWFKGARYPNRYITQHITSGFGHLKKLGIAANTKEQEMLQKAVLFLDGEIIEDYRKLQVRAKRIRESAKTKARGAKNEAEFWSKNHTGNYQIQYLYMRSFYKEIDIKAEVKEAVDYFTAQAYNFWLDQNLYTKGMIALIAKRNNNENAIKILESLEQNAVSNEELGMYWKENTASWYWYQAPIETQALMIEAFSEISGDSKVIDELKVLVVEEQTNQ